MSTAAGAVVVALGSPLAAVGAYQVALAVAALAYRVDAGDTPKARILVVVPAHDEATLITRCVASLRAQDYPSLLYDVVVVADNCTDDTAVLAERAGVRVLERRDPSARGKGHALRWAFDRLLAEHDGADAFAVVDADSVAAPSFLRALAGPLEAGAPVAQGESLLELDGTVGTAFRAAAFLLINRVRPAGRSVLGLTTRLSGNGMLFRRDVLQRHPWSAFSSTEDVEYSLRLRSAGIGTSFAGGAVLMSPAAPNADAAAEQQLRWEGGKLHLARVWLPRLLSQAVRERDAGLIDAAIELAVPPLGLFAAASVLGASATAMLTATGLIPWWVLAPWLAALVSLPVYVLVGLRAANAPASAYRAILLAPFFVARKLRHLRRFVAFRGDTWVRTERAESNREDGP